MTRSPLPKLRPSSHVPLQLIFPHTFLHLCNPSICGTTLLESHLCDVRNRASAYPYITQHPILLRKGRERCGSRPKEKKNCIVAACRATLYSDMRNKQIRLLFSIPPLRSPVPFPSFLL
ncbi:hypothetical protein M434DRAFT_327285 [Hypoxylon sp. CO27-5]|nr:hypothetical protein M434DRAFT_327285 [Hypoxylon sp. CO27-5]